MNKWHSFFIGLFVVLVTMFLIPDVYVIFSLMFAMACIIMCVIGGMVLLDVYLDIISMICLIMCVGFSKFKFNSIMRIGHNPWFHGIFLGVDFCAHICHSYFHSNKPLKRQRIEECLASYGVPVFQGAISTILGVLPLLLCQSYILHSFTKMVILVVGSGLFYGIIVIPTLFMLFGKDSNVQSNSWTFFKVVYVFYAVLIE